MQSHPFAYENQENHPVRWSVVTVAFLAILLDGFDTTLIAFVVPALSKEWALPVSAFSPVFIATSVGAVIGYLLSGRVSERYGKKTVIIISVIGFALGSIATLLSHSIFTLAAWRLVTGIGLGAVLPPAVALAVANGPSGRKEAVSVAVGAGLSLGATIGGLVGGALIERFGWQSLFVLGSILPALLVPLLIWVLPGHESGNKVLSSTSAGVPECRSGGVASLLKKPQRLQTMLLWSFSLFTFTTFYALCFWVPTVLTTLGFTVANAALGVAALGGGGVIGSLLLIPLAARFGIRQILMVTSMATVALVGMTALRAFSPSELLIAIGAIGACLVAGTLGQVAIAVRMYEVQAQTTGVGYSAAWGRIGSIVGPAAGGLLISAGFEPQQLLFSAGVPAALAALIMALLLLTARKQVVQADALGQVD